MRKLKVSKIWILAFLLAVLVAGCGDSDKGATGGPLTPPTVLPASSTSPPTPTPGVTILCPNIAIITATFNKDMNPATINSPATTFTLTGPSGAVSGAVTYVAATRIATFAQATPPGLVVGTTYTATITTGAADTFGNHVAANFTWTFTTSGPCPGPPATIALGTSCGFGILAATASVTNTGGTIVTGGDVGISPAASITGFPPGTIIAPNTTHAADATAALAQTDLNTAYTSATPANLPNGIPIPSDIGNLPQTFAPGVYTATSTLGITGDLTLDGSTNPNGTWVFQVGSALTTAAGGAGTPASRVLLIGGALPGHVFWQITSSAVLGTNSVFVGNIMALSSITVGTGASLNGRALAHTGAVTLENNAVTVPTPCQ